MFVSEAMNVSKRRQPTDGSENLRQTDNKRSRRFVCVANAFDHGWFLLS
jgi:hypothetical protein